MNNTLSNQLAAIEAEALSGVRCLRTLEDVKQYRAKYLGRNGIVTGLLKTLGTMPAEERPEAGKKINGLKVSLEERFSAVESKLNSGQIEKVLQEQVDITLSGRFVLPGNFHPVTQILGRIQDIFTGLGFSIHEGPEIESDYYNFEALNVPKDHPARDMQDTFYVMPKNLVMPLCCSAVMQSDSKTEFLLRTHTSPVQIHVMKKFKPPIRMIFPGAVYRRDADLSHSPMFHQVEGLQVGEDITMGDLKGVLTSFLHQMFGQDAKVRFRPSFFPFTEPSAEVDIECFMCRGSARLADGSPCRVCKQSGWMEILGCGMVDPNVFEAVGYDPKKVTGFAFGMGVERIAMLKFGISDIRLFFENDVRFLKQF